MSGRSSRTKGASSERELAKIFRARGWDAKRTPLSGGMHIKGDLITDIPFLHIEAKRQEKLAIPAWIRQSESDCPKGKIPSVVFRQSRQPWRIVVPLDHYLDLVDVARAYAREVGGALSGVDKE